MCALVLGLDDYGEARFVASPSMAPVFELQAALDLHAPGPIEVHRFAPDWHPAAPLRETLGEVFHINGGGGVARDALAANMLLSLRQGLHLELAANAWFEPYRNVTLQLVAKDLRPALDAFLQCAHSNVEVSWQKMSRTRVLYEVDKHALHDTERDKLASVVRFVNQDPSITTIFVDGHTDSSGGEKKNYQLSKRRAQTVADYLKQVGLRSCQVVVRYHGAAYPVATNANTTGKALNRRTTVRLAREDAQAVAQQ